MMQLLLENPYLLLEGRIAFRRRWVVANAPLPPERPETDWELDYDEKHNFAHMGADLVDEEWGKVQPIKPKARKFSDFLSPAFIEATADSIGVSKAKRKKRTASIVARSLALTSKDSQ